MDLARVATQALEHGDVLELGRAPDGRPGWRLHVRHTPGHAPGHLVFIEDRYRAAIVGDMVSTLSTIVIDPPEGHMATYLDSLRALLAEDIGTLYPAHGLAQLDGPALLRRYISHREERESKLVRAIDAGHATSTRCCLWSTTTRPRSCAPSRGARSSPDWSSWLRRDTSPHSAWSRRRPQSWSEPRGPRAPIRVELDAPGIGQLGAGTSSTKL